jgi:predicted DNA-binding antitoxin AbrB/MazE fold protein
MLITATYDGKVFKPKTPLDLDIDQEYQIEVINDVKKTDTNNVSLGEKLRKIRQKIVDSGIPLLSEEEVEREKATRQGGWQEN